MKKAQVQVQVAEEDVDDVIEIAARIMMEEEGQLTLAELQEVGEELDIPAEYIERAQKQLQTDRAQAKVQLQKELEDKKRFKMVGLFGGVGLVSVVSLWTLITASTLSSLHAEVEASKAQVQNVQARKQTVAEMLKDRPNSPDKDAELIGAENRIRVETKRYSDAASKYNSKSNGIFGGIASSLTGLPKQVPASP